MVFRRLLLPALAAAVCCAAAEPQLFIEDASARTPGNFAPVHEGRSVQMRGTLAAPPVRIRDYTHAVIQDVEGRGFTLEATGDVLQPFHSGDHVEATGVISHRAGLPVLHVAQVIKVFSTDPPLPQRLEVSDLTRVANLGRYVSVESYVITHGQNSGGDVLVIGNAEASIPVFLPRAQAPGDAGLQRFVAGDRIRIVGLSSQYCAIPPYNRGFQLVVARSGDIALLSRGWLISPSVLAYCFLGVAFAAAVWWRRERALAHQRRVLRMMMTLSEDVISAASPRDIVRRLYSDLPRAIRADDVDLFLYDRPNNRLDRVIVNDKSPQPLSISVDAAIGSFHSTVALCFRNRALLHVPDTRRSPLLTGREKQVPASAVFIPMLAQGELLGVLAVYCSASVRQANPDHQAALQHLGNQIAASLKLQEQQHMREQLLRSEKMAAAGQLISGVANDLRTPLENISRNARRVADRVGATRPELHDIYADAERGLEIVNHLLSFARMERTQARLLDIFEVVNRLLEIREEERERKGIKAESTLPLSPLNVLADQAQLEQAFLTLLVHAEHAATLAADKTMRVSSRVVGKKVQLAIECTLGPATDPFEDLGQGDYFGLPVAQAIAQSHGGDIRYLPGRTGCRLELELPVHAPSALPEKPAPPLPRPVRVLTALIVEPDMAGQRRLLAMLAVRGHRAIPAATAEDAADLVQRLAFDVVFCAVRLPGLNWVELFQRVRRRIGAFALLTEGYDAESARAFKGGEGHVIPKPLEDHDLDQFLALVEVRLAAVRR